MKLKLDRPSYVFVLMFSLLAVVLVSCTPGADPVSVTRPLATEAVPITNTGWCVGGPELFKPKDMACYLGSRESDSVQSINGETIFIYAEPGSVNDWAGAAVIFHEPTQSMVAFDEFGDVNPLTSVFTSRAGLAAFDELLADTVFLADLKEQIQERYQTSSPGEPEIRLSVAWQDGVTTIFQVAIVGLDSDDDRFYCPGQTWTIGDMTVASEPSCVPRDPDVPVRTHFFESQMIEGLDPQLVQVEINGVVSNNALIGETEVAEETAVYLAALEQVTNRTLLIRGETGAELDDVALRERGVGSRLIESFLEVNEKPASLRFLFQHNDVYHVHPSEAINLNFLRPGSAQEACQQFREEYTGLGGIITLSGIGFSEDGSEALVYVEKECGTSVKSAAYYVLAKTADGWQVRDSFEVVVDLPSLTPELVYDDRAEGCGGLFVYKGNERMSEYVTVLIETGELPLTVEPVTFALADYPDKIKVRIAVFADNVHRLGQFPYCNDVGPMAEFQSLWEAVGGSVTVSVTAESVGDQPCESEPYWTTVLLEDVTFAYGDETVYLDSLIFDDVHVGWCPG